MALGTFAIGTESFMIAAILPRIAADLSVTVAVAGQLISIFALSYAVSSPILTALTGGVDRRRLLLLSMVAFSLANVVAASTGSYAALATARVLLAWAAGLYTPNANALASLLAGPQHRGRAIAIVSGGASLAMAIGVPLGAVVGHWFGWRMTFAGVAVLGSVATAGLLAGLPARVGAGIVTATLADSVRVVRQPRVSPALFVTTICAVGTYAVYTFVASYVTSATSLRGAQVGYALFLWGVSAGVGLMIGGRSTDKFGVRRVICATIAMLALALASLSAFSHWIPSDVALIPILLAISLWGVSTWAFFPAQQTRLIEIAGIKLAPIVLSLNASFTYMGFSLGAALGAFALVRTGITSLGWVGAACEMIGLVLFLATSRPSPAPRAPSQMRTSSVQREP
jgi:predicted MFS family arabinose efflux permease